MEETTRVVMGDARCADRRLCVHRLGGPHHRAVQSRSTCLLYSVHGYLQIYIYVHTGRHAGRRTARRDHAHEARRGTAPWRCETMGVCVQSGDGTDGEHIPHFSFFPDEPELTARAGSRLYSTKTLKPLGTLKYHKTACQCLEFARRIPSTGVPEEVPGREEVDEDDGEEMSAAEIEERERWLVTGSKDSRVAIWSLLSFDK